MVLLKIIVDIYNERNNIFSRFMFSRNVFFSSFFLFFSRLKMLKRNFHRKIWDILYEYIYKHLKYKIKAKCYSFRSFPIAILCETDERKFWRFVDDVLMLNFHCFLLPLSYLGVTNLLHTAHTPGAMLQWTIKGKREQI